MALTKTLEHQVTVNSDGQLAVRETTIISEDGVEISRAHHRKMVDVGSDVSNEVQIVKDLASTVHTPARVAARVAVKAAEKVLGS